MSQLEILQHQFWNSLRTNDSEPRSISSLSDGGMLSKMDRLKIYQNTMRTAHTSALAECFKCCEIILGNQYFNRVANEYFYSNPAMSQNINLYGQQFPQYLESWVYNHTETEKFKYLPDLAKLEYAYEKAYYLNDDPIFDFDAFSKLNGSEQQHITFNASHSLKLLKSDYPIYEIWNINRKNETTHKVHSISEPQYLCVTRDNFQPIINILAAHTWWVLSNIQRSLSLNAMHTLNQDKNINAPLNTIIPTLIQNKWICGFSLTNNSC